MLSRELFSLGGELWGTILKALNLGGGLWGTIPKALELGGKDDGGGKGLSVLAESSWETTLKKPEAEVFEMVVSRTTAVQRDRKSVV